MPGFMKDMMGVGMSGPLAAAINGVGQSAQTATGSTQADAFALTYCTTEFTTTAASTGAVLPGTGKNVSSGDVLAVINQGANTLTVYPPVGFKIGLTATNGGVSITTGKVGLFLARGDGNYFQLLGA